MPYSKPLVTIELEEYNELIERIQDLKTKNYNEENVVLKEALFYILRLGDNMDLFQMLSNYGIIVGINTYSTSDLVHEKIFVKRANK